MDDMRNYRDMLVKRPFFEVTPKGYMSHAYGTEEIASTSDTMMPHDTLYRRIKTQDDFTREFYPSGHVIWDGERYPDVWKHNPEDGKWYRQEICRTAFAFQQLIYTKHLLHLSGNDVQFEIAEGADEDRDDEFGKLLSLFRKKWLMSGMEEKCFDAFSSYLKVADAAIVGYFDSEGKFGTKVLGYDRGDTLYPQYDPLTGRMTAFARKYYDYDEKGDCKTEWVEVWDEKKFYRFKDSVGEKGAGEMFKRIGRIFGISKCTCTDEREHGFPFIPVAYCRNEDGPCWSAVQKNIEDYEESFSYLCENNKAYAFPMLKLKGDGDGIDIIGDNSGAAKVIRLTDIEGDADFISGTDASAAFATQLNKSYELIYELSFTVKPPELKSGDLPGVALKLLYSPAIEAAMNDSQKLHPFISDTVRICKYGYGVEEDCVASMLGVPMNVWIEPYVHQNDTELFTNLATAVQNRFMSKQTASERNSKYSKNDEFSRIIREYKQEQEMDLLMDIRRADNDAENDMEQQVLQAKINGGKSGNDVNTGGGSGRKRGRPDEGKNTDENGNRPGENNWKSADRYRKR